MTTEKTLLPECEAKASSYEVHAEDVSLIISLERMTVLFGVGCFLLLWLFMVLEIFLY